MSSEDTDQTPLRRLAVEAQALACLMTTIGSLDIEDDELTRFDRLTADMKRHGRSLHEASNATADPVTDQVIAIVIGGYINNWLDGGASAALLLPEYNDFAEVVKATSASKFEIVQLVAAAVRELAYARFTDEDQRLTDAGKTMLKLLNTLMRMESIDTDGIVKVALACYEVLSAVGDRDAQLAQAVAYRLLVWSKQLPFLADLAPTKFPPPIIPKYPSETLLMLCLSFIEEGILNQPLDLSALAREMVEDREIVIKNSVNVTLDGANDFIKLELAIAPALLRWALDDRSEESRKFGGSANDRIRAWLSVICENRVLLERHRDDDFCDVYVAAYIGIEEREESRIGLALKTESMGEHLKCIVGLSEEDIRAIESRDLIFRPREAEVISHLKNTILDDRLVS